MILNTQELKTIKITMANILPDVSFKKAALEDVVKLDIDEYDMIILRDAQRIKILQHRELMSLEEEFDSDNG